MEIYDQEKYLLTTSVHSKTNKEGLKSTTGLVLKHTYSLLACLEVNGVKLCRLRNPWGKTEWKGDWSDNSSLWTPAMKVSHIKTKNNIC
jgi:hypothetical protein